MVRSLAEICYEMVSDEPSDLMLSWHSIRLAGGKKSSVLKLARRMLCCKNCQGSDDVLILDTVSGYAESGSLFGILGASGSGKTSLLGVISKRTTANVIGSVRLSGHEISRDKLISISGFVPQNDIAVTTLTLSEHVYFMSQMKMDRKVRKETRKQWISSLLSELSLSNLENTPLSVLSGGERKRLSIAVELLNDPRILFCDEPTTGLDSYNALGIVQKLQMLSRRGKIIICSIHQPSSEVFSYFQQLVLLTEGQVAYQGPTDKVLEFFTSLGYKCPASYTTADFLIMTLAEKPDYKKLRIATNIHVCIKFLDTEWQQKIDEVRHYQESDSIAPYLRRLDSIKTPTWLFKTYILLWRSFLDLKRTKLGHMQQVLVFLVTSIMLAIFYMDVTSTTQEGIQDIHGLLYLISTEIYFTSAYRVIHTFPQEIAIFLREKYLYPTSAYYIAKTISLVPRFVIEPAAYLGIIWVIQSIGGSETIAYFALLGPLLLSACAASSYGCMLSAIFDSSDVAPVISVPLDLLAMLMAGMFYNIGSLPSSIIWLKYLSQLHYTNEIFSVLQWQDVANITCPEDPTLPCLATGLQVLETYGYAVSNLYVDILALIAIFFILNIIGYLGLYCRSKKQTVY